MNSTYRYCGGTRGLTADIKPNPGSVRSELFRTYEYRQSNAASYETAEVRSYNDPLIYQ